MKSVDFGKSETNKSQIALRNKFEFYQKAFDFYQKAAQLGNARAMCKLGYMYEKGKSCKQSNIKAFKFYQKAAQLGDISAMCNLGFMYYEGLGCEQSHAKAFEFYQKSWSTWQY